MMFLLEIPNFASPEIWISLLTLTFLEVVLGIDNIIFISIITAKLPKEKQPRTRFIGLALALVFRIGLLFGISWLIAMKAVVFQMETAVFEGYFSGQSLILIAGGLFLLYKSTTEIHHKLEGEDMPAKSGKKVAARNVTSAIIQIILIDMVFSIDSILTAVGLTDFILIMIIAVTISIIIMMIFANPVGNFVNDHPSIQMLALAFLILIGFMLIAEGAHLAHVEVAEQPVGSIPKGYLYFAIAFSLGVEFLNLRMRKKREPVQLHSISQKAAEEGVLKKEKSE